MSLPGDRPQEWCQANTAPRARKARKTKRIALRYRDLERTARVRHGIPRPGGLRRQRDDVDDLRDSQASDVFEFFMATGIQVDQVGDPGIGGLDEDRLPLRPRPAYAELDAVRFRRRHPTDDVLGGSNGAMTALSSCAHTTAFMM